MRQLLIVQAALMLLSLTVPNMAAPVHTPPTQLPLSDLHQQTWTTRQGLPHNTINAITQTPDGYLWLATWEGIARFNGHRFRLFERGPETGLPDVGVRSLTVDHRGRLLAGGARGGLSMVQDGHWRKLERAPTMVIHAVHDRQGRLWLGTQGGGVVRRPDPTQDGDDEQSAFLEGATVQRILPDETGVWVASSLGLARIENDQARIFTDAGLPEAPVLSLLETEDGRLLVGTESGLFVREGDTTAFRPLAPEFDGLAVSALLQDAAGSLWIGTISVGLYRLRNGLIDHIGTDSGLPNNRVLSIYQDLENSIWVGTNGGLFRLRSAPFVTTTREEGLAGNYVRAVMPHSNGSLWVGTSEGVSRIRGESIETIRDGTDPIGHSILSLAEATDGSVYIGTHSGGVLRWRDGRIVSTFNRSEGLPSNDIRFLHEDGNGLLWVATANGVARLDENGTTVYSPEDGLPGDFVIALAEDRQGRIWAGTGFGMARYENGRFEPVSLYHLDETMYVYGIHVDRVENWLWLATDRGLIRYHPDTGAAELIGRDAGIPVDKLFHVVDDRNDAFWLTSNRGIVRVAREQAIAVAERRRNRVDFELYTEGDGMLSAQANGGAGPPAAWHDGRVWIATAVGLTSVDPGHLTRYEDTSLPVSIEQFEADGVAWPVNDALELPAGTERVVIQYAGLGFIMPQRIRYRTRLEGFDARWVERGGQSVAEYTNLGPGDYVFHVSASYPYGDWNGSEARLRFSITPLPWQRTWFWIAALLLLFATVILLTQWRMRRLAIRAADLRAQIDEKTRELKQQADNFERQARIDQLTGLANRRAFDEWLAGEFRRSRNEDRPLSLVIMDLDHFKAINDRYSHLVGDEVMRVVANVLRQHVRGGDQAARWGGEEFTLTFHDIDAERAEQISERIRQSLESTDFGQLAPDLGITASFGVSDSRQAENYEDLLRRADQALLRAKAAGRNRVVRHMAGNDQ